MEREEHMIDGVEENQTWAISGLVSSFGRVIVNELVCPPTEMSDTLALLFDRMRIGLVEVREDGEVRVLPFRELGPETATLVARIDITVTAPRVL
jgi:hypothetical protein